MRLLALAMGLMLSCRGPVAPAAPAGDVDAAMAELRFRIASSPDDLPAHLGLARLADGAGLPGAALRHYQIVARNRSLADPDRRALARLLAARAGERVDAGDGGANDDLVRARGYHAAVAVDPAIEVEAHALAALAGLRRRESAAVTRALTALAARAPHDARTAILDPQGAALDRLGEAAAWAWDGGARREAAALLDGYVSRGGRDPAVLARFARARYWWGGAAGLDYLDRSMLIEHGVELCSIARAPDERGCAGRLDALLADPVRGPALAIRARRLHWPVDPAPAPPVREQARPAPLVAIERAFARDAALADRLARDYVDGAHAVATRGIEVAELFAGAGDPARALSWWDEVAASSPGHAPYVRALALAATRARDSARALVHADEAAAASGDGGAVYLAVAEALLAADFPAEALHAVRDAVNLTAETEQVDALAIGLVAVERLGRPAEAAQTRAAYLARIDPRYRARAEAWLDQLTAPAGGSDR